MPFKAETHSIRLQQIQEEIELFHNIVLFPTPLRTFPNNIYFCHLAHYRKAGGGMEEWGGGFTCWAALSDSTANSTDRLFRAWRRAPQVLWDEAQVGREEPSEPKALREQMDADHCAGIILGWECCRSERHEHDFWARIVPLHTWAPCQTSEDPWRSPWSARPFSLLCPAACWSCCGYF